MKVLYICGIGHSGSTIVDLGLGMCSRVLSAGQVNELLAPYDPFDLPKSDCSYGSCLWRTALESLTASEQRQLKIFHYGVLREKLLFRLLFRRSARAYYSNLSERIYQSIGKESDAEVVIDSSKNISRCLAISEMKNAELYVLHLTRDPRDFIVSRSKRTGEKSAFSSMLRWLVKNMLASFVGKKCSSKFLRVKYEDIVLDPDSVVDRLEAWLDLELPIAREVFSGNLEIDPNESVGFGGNRVLHQRKSLRFAGSESNCHSDRDSRLFWYSIGWLSQFWGYWRKSGGMTKT